MGNDGGSIPTRRELVKEAARDPTTTELKQSQNEQQEYHWTTDPLSNRPLTRPIVADSGGKLYNKDSIIEYLLPSDDDAKKTESEKILQGSVKSLRDVVEVKFEIDETAQERDASKALHFICPITNKPLGPGSKAVYLVPCGHAFSAMAIKEVADEKCLQCNESYAPNDIIPIIPTDATDIARLALRLQTLNEKGLSHSLKKLPGSGKKRKKTGADNTAATEPDTLKLSGDNLEKASSKGSAQQPKSTSNGIKNAATASLTARVMEEQEHKRQRLGKNENLKGLFTSSDSKQPKTRNTDFMSRGFSIPASSKR